MIAEIGHYALVLALAVALCQSTIPMWGAHRGDRAMMAVGDMTAIAQLAFVALSFAMLMVAYVQSDFSVINVYQNSHSDKPLIYKITGVWGNHEGSMVLWVLILALFGAFVAMFGSNLPQSLRSRVLGVQGWVSVAFLLFIVLTSNPFLRLDPAPIEGQDLNPLLQDIGLAIHPPLLYVGYVGFSISFSFAIAALIEGRLDAAWARWVRPWTLAAWMFLTLGISVGSYWAYYELGWGGWWFWDPVENASFMPWLLGTALLHSAIVMEKRDALKVWTILLAILTFSLSLLGTFLVRSGVLTSVHAFAVDPARGVFILAILVVFTGGALALFALRSAELRSGSVFAPISREGALVFNNLILTAACGVVFVGTLYPLALEAVTGEKISVGPPFFNMTFGPLMIPLLLAVPFGPMLAWKRGDLYAVTQRLFWAMVLSFVAGLGIWWAFYGGPVLAGLGLALGFWLIFGAIAEIAFRSQAGKVPFGDFLRRAMNLPRAAWGTALAHAGVGVMVLGIVGVTVFEQEKILVMTPGEQAEIGGYDITFQGLVPETGPNYEDLEGHFLIARAGELIAQVDPSKRVYIATGMPTTEAGIVTVFPSQVYITLGDPMGDDGISVRLYTKPFVTLIWIGTLIMFFGGLASLTDRRLRVGAPKPSRAKQTLQPAE